MARMCGGNKIKTGDVEELVPTLRYGKIEITPSKQNLPKLPYRFPTEPKPFPYRRQLPPISKNCCRRITEEMGHVTLREGLKSTKEESYPPNPTKDKHMWARNELDAEPDDVLPVYERHRKHFNARPELAIYQQYDMEREQLPPQHQVWRMERQPALGIKPDSVDMERFSVETQVLNPKKYTTQYSDSYWNQHHICCGFYERKGPFYDLLPIYQHHSRLKQDRRLHCRVGFQFNG